MKKTNEYWAEKAKLPAPEGYVRIGKGDDTYFLKNYFSPVYILDSDGTIDFSCYFDGNAPNAEYVTTVKVWEEKTGLKFNQITEKNMSKGIYTKRDPAAVEIVKKMVADRGMKWYNSDNWIIRSSNSSVESKCFDCGDENWFRGGAKGYNEVPLYEFIYELGKIPVKQKEIAIDILPWKVVIKGDKVDIGCRKGISLSMVKQSINNIKNGEGEINVIGETAYCSREGLRMSGQSLVTWETMDKFIEEFNKLVK